MTRAQANINTRPPTLMTANNVFPGWTGRPKTDRETDRQKVVLVVFGSDDLFTIRLQENRSGQCVQTGLI